MPQSALRTALLLWTVPMVITSFFSAYQGTRSLSMAILIALASVMPFFLLVPLSKFWFSLPLVLRVLLAFTLGIVRAWSVNLFAQGDPYTVQNISVAGFFAMFWWLAVEHTLDAQGSLNRKYQDLTTFSRLELAGRLEHESAARAETHFAKIKDTMEAFASKGSVRIGFDALALAALENEISATTRQMGFFQSGMPEGLPKVRFLSGLTNILRRPTFDLSFAGFAYGAMAVVGSVSAFSIERTILSVPASVLIFVAFLCLSNRARASSLSGLLAHTLFLLAVTMPILVPDALLVAMGFQSGLSDWRVAVGTPLTLFSISVGSAVLGHLQRVHGELLQHLAVRLSDHEMLALYLHNSLKSELLALAMRLQSSTDTKVRDQTWAELKEMLLQDVTEEAKTSQIRPRERFIRVLDSWNPILEIDALEFLQSEAANSSLACRFVEEAIANAVRHSLATQVRVLSEDKPHKWVLTVQSNGSAETTKHDLGFGLRALEKAAESWTLASGPAGSVLKIHLPKH